MKWRVEFDDDEGMWLRSNTTTVTLHMNGYAVGGFLDTAKGVRTYTLHRADDKGYPIVYETTDLDELNRYINLVLPAGESET